MLFTLKFISYLVSIKSTYIAYKKKITNFIIESYLVSWLQVTSVYRIYFPVGHILNLLSQHTPLK